MNTVRLTEYAVHIWDGWHRHVILARLAHAFPNIVRARSHGPLAREQRGESLGQQWDAYSGVPAGCIPLTVPEIRRPLARPWAVPPRDAMLWR